MHNHKSRQKHKRRHKRVNKRKYRGKHSNSYLIAKTGLDAGKGTNASYKHKDQSVSFSLCLSLRLCCKRKNEIPLRYNTTTRIFTTPGYVRPMKRLDPDDLTPKQLGKLG